MSLKPNPFRPGQLITADRLNQLRREGIRDQQLRTSGPGMSVVDDYMSGGQSAHQAKPGTILCRAIEDFDVNRYTDAYSWPDPVPSGLCRLIRMRPDNGQYEMESSDTPEFRVWDPMALIMGATSKSEGDSFYAAYNKDSGRVEVIGVGGPSVEIRHGLVSECLGMGWYLVELMDCIQYEPPECENYNPWSESQSQSSSASASESPPEACDACDFRAPPQCEGDSSDVDFQQECGGGDVVIPLRPRRDSTCYPLVGNGEFVYALDKRTIPLVIDGMVTIVWFGDRCLGGSGTGWESGCGSESASEPGDEGAKLYNVINGEYRMVNIPIKTYECCEDGIVRQVGCTNYLVEGIVCATPETPCPTSDSSSSGSASSGGGGGGGDPGPPGPGLEGGESP